MIFCYQSIYEAYKSKKVEETDFVFYTFKLYKTLPDM